MNLTDILLFGKAIIGDGGSSDNGLKTVTFDGNLDGKETFSAELMELSGVFVKVLDTVISPDEMQDIIFTLNTTEGDVVSNSIMEDIQPFTEDGGGGYLKKSTESPVVFYFQNDIPMTEDGTVMAKAGTYVLYDENYLGLGAGYVSALVYGESGGGTSGGAKVWVYKASADQITTADKIPAELFGVEFIRITDPIPYDTIKNSIIFYKDITMGDGHVLQYGDFHGFGAGYDSDVFVDEETGIVLVMDLVGAILIIVSEEVSVMLQSAMGITIKAGTYVAGEFSMDTIVICAGELTKLP